MSAKVYPVKYQASCEECGVGIENASQWFAARWVVIHNYNHHEAPGCPETTPNEEDA